MVQSPVPAPADIDATFEKDCTFLKKPDELVQEEFASDNLAVAGHSLGGADAQNYTSQLLSHIADQFKHNFHSQIKGFKKGDVSNLTKISNISLFTKCSAGVPEAANKRIKHALGRLKTRLGKMWPGLDILHMKIEGDAVQATGDEHVGAGLKPKKAKVQVLKIYPDEQDNRIKRHTGKFFIDDKNQSRVCAYETYSNETDEGRKDVIFSLKDTSTVLRNRVVKVATGALNCVLRGTLLRWFA
ncbi:hypothetical protein GZ77_13750 [Endozoicomonas montiporae]|uniref:Uncharacterized protein n=2 Tax=Endozoicomonas montiporae TaxID=1027273 RepID=A0A081N4R4_9GAMM|nr:hypothetical protein [Endozoicomonas montiporae]AMO57691.1 hypothetical protein EZMO1_3733 [Endozoicomonas montiporae CL-33]KEQ13437.1 hypothetical protein GZ77_13750 [Endozoicomonas montiporae]